MTDIPDNQAAAESARARLQDALNNGARMTPFCRAVIGWLCECPTEPSLAAIRVSGDGRVWLRLSDEAYPEPSGTFLEFLTQVGVLCQSLNLDEAQTRHVVGWAQSRLF